MKKNLSSDELMAFPENELEQHVLDTNMFTLMLPDDKLKIINALKEKNEIVAITGDGVNDGHTLRSAHIGIAVGKGNRDCQTSRITYFIGK